MRLEILVSKLLGRVYAGPFVTGSYEKPCLIVIIGQVLALAALPLEGKFNRRNELETLRLLNCPTTLYENLWGYTCAPEELLQLIAIHLGLSSENAEKLSGKRLCIA